MVISFLDRALQFIDFGQERLQCLIERNQRVSPITRNGRQGFFFLVEFSETTHFIVDNRVCVCKWEEKFFAASTLSSFALKTIVR